MFKWWSFKCARYVHISQIFLLYFCTLGVGWGMSLILVMSMVMCTMWCHVWTNCFEEWSNYVSPGTSVRCIPAALRLFITAFVEKDYNSIKCSTAWFRSAPRANQRLAIKRGVTCNGTCTHAHVQQSQITALLICSCTHIHKQTQI